MAIIGGAVALLVHITVFPVKARTKLKECLATAITQINLMESCVALGVDEKQTHMLKHPRFLKRFERAAKKAGVALNAAEAFLEYARHEPRVKGKWEPHRVVYKEILFVLRQIVERMENLLRLRTAFGSAVLEEFNARVHGYRRNVAAAITLTLYAVEQSLTQKLPLPQFLPSARLAHLRMIVRVRQILHEDAASGATTPRRSRGGSMKDQQSADEEDGIEIGSVETPSPASGAPNGVPSLQRSFSTTGQINHRRRALCLKILSWNASTAALEECVEYVEELVDLVKLLVGVNEFRSGILHRPTFGEYLGGVYPLTSVNGGTATVGTAEEIARMGRVNSGGNVLRIARTASTLEERLYLDGTEGQAGHDEEADTVNALARTTSVSASLPLPLTRIHSRREAERLKRKKD